MMSVSPGMYAGQAGGYFSREDYYLRGNDQGINSRWFGRGDESLGLSGPVRKEEFRALCAGRHPLSGELLVVPKLIRNQKTGELVEIHRARNDCTFSAPKSVSILYAAGAEQLLEMIGVSAATQWRMEDVPRETRHLPPLRRRVPARRSIGPASGRGRGLVVFKGEKCACGGKPASSKECRARGTPYPLGEWERGALAAPRSDPDQEK